MGEVMTRIIRAIAFACFGVLLSLGSAGAADLKLAPKAAAPASCTQTSCSGLYLTGGITGIGTNVDVIGQGVNGSLFAGGGIVDIGGGYQLWNGSYFAAIEATIGIEATNRGVAGPAIGPGSLVGLEQVKLGGALAGLLGQAQPAASAPGQAPTTIPVPAALAQAFMSPYAAIGVMQRGGNNMMVTGVGAEFVLSQGFSADLEYLYQPAMSSEPPSNLIRASLQYHFKP
jgi:hypothetical protein